MCCASARALRPRLSLRLAPAPAPRRPVELSAVPQGAQRFGGGPLACCAPLQRALDSCFALPAAPRPHPQAYDADWGGAPGDWKAQAHTLLHGYGLLQWGRGRFSPRGAARRGAPEWLQALQSWLYNFPLGQTHGTAGEVPAWGLLARYIEREVGGWRVGGGPLFAQQQPGADLSLSPHGRIPAAAAPHPL